MHTQFKRHQRVELLIAPDPEYIEWYVDVPTTIKKGARGKINMMLPSGQYHVEIIDEKTNETIAYVVVAEEYLTPLSE